MMKKFNYISLIILLLIILSISIIFAVTIGSTHIPFEVVWGIIFNKISSIIGWNYDETLIKGATHDIVILIRLPRIILASIVGLGLSVCGVVTQAIVKNPIADPYILGISSGASLGATLAIMLGFGTFMGSNAIGVMGCLGAFAVSISVLILSNIGGRSNSVKLLLSGMALSSLCSAFSSFIIYFANDKEGMMTITYWLMGSLAGANWDTIAILFPIVIGVSLYFCTQYRTLNLMLFGDEQAVSLGANLSLYRNLYLLCSSLIIGFIVYSAGMIGFIGLIIPHISRYLVGNNHKKLTPVAALLGSILLVWADVLCRTIIPKNELPIGILISMIGSPAFIYLMLKQTNQQTD